MELILKYSVEKKMLTETISSNEEKIYEVDQIDRDITDLENN